MKALTLWQPWAWAICHAGKRIENRTWPPPNEIFGKQIAIHAGNRVDDAAVLQLAKMFPELWPGKVGLTHGAIVAVVTVTGFTRSSTDRWFSGPVGWQLADVIVLKQPIACRGFQKLWDLPAQVLHEVEVINDAIRP